LPAKARQPKAVTTPTVYTPQGSAPVYSAPAAASTPVKEEVHQEVQVPESPIGIWTIIFSIVFVIFLVGSVALYRARLHRLEKPPTVTRTGLEAIGLPETSSDASKPAPLLLKEEKPVAEPKQPQIKHEEPKPVVKPAEIRISAAKTLELERYIFHAYSLGFKESQVRKVLIEKGWPESAVDKVLSQVKSKK
jgi:hypothetical protein